jgi:hypothetical protein
VAQVLRLVALTEESSRRKSGGRRRSGGKKIELPLLPYLYRGTAVVEHYNRAHDPDRFCKRRHVVARRGAAVPVTVPLCQLW